MNSSFCVKAQALDLCGSKLAQRNETVLIALAGDVLIVKNGVSVMTILHLSDIADTAGPGYLYLHKCKFQWKPTGIVLKGLFPFRDTGDDIRQLCTHTCRDFL